MNFQFLLECEMADPIGLVLGTIALLDPVYTRIKAIWRGCKVVGEFGVAFNRFASRIRVQETLFLASIRKYHDHLDKGAIETQWINHALRETIETQVAEIVTVFEACYTVANAYHSRGEL